MSNLVYEYFCIHRTLNLSILHQVYKYPKQAFHFLKRYYFNAAQKHSTKWLWLTLHAPIQQFLFAYFLSILTVSLVVNIIAFIVFAVAFLVMMVATVEIFDNMEKISSSKKISFILQYFGKIEAKAPEQQVRSSIGHYATYIIAFPIAIGVLKMAQQQPVFMYIGMCLTVPAAMILVAIFVDFCTTEPFSHFRYSTRTVYVFSDQGSIESHFRAALCKAESIVYDKYQLQLIHSGTISNTVGITDIHYPEEA